ncbi:MAG: VCBS repeat-containing protein [Cyclobacteriaceae bacterium]
MKRLISLIALLHSLNGNGQSSFKELVLEGPEYEIVDAIGVAVGDFNNDGFDDILVAGKPSRIYRNNGNLTFSEISEIANLSNVQANSGVWFDADNDGLLDLLLDEPDQTSIYYNQGDETFQFGSSLGTAQRKAILIGDLNEDEWPDIYSANFRQKNHLFINQGNKTFTPFGEDVTKGELDMGAILIDFEGDGDLDVYQVYDGHRPNELLINDGNARFVDHAKEYGLDNESFGMGVDYGDFNHDGQFDFYITNLYANDLLLSLPDKTYEEQAVDAGLDDQGMGWGVVSLDFDNDGLEDVYFVNEYKYSPHPAKLFRNNGDQTFSVASSSSELENEMSGYGCVTSDLNNDGALDIIVANKNSEKDIRIFINQNSSGYWMQLSLIGTKTNKFGIGTRVKAYVNGEVIMKDLNVGSGYHSQRGFRMQFGLGTSDHVDSLVINWPDGSKEQLFDVLGNQRYIAYQGNGLIEFDPDVFRNLSAEQSLLEEPTTVRSADIDNNDKSVARYWNELILEAIRGDFARPTVHARNLYHLSLALYDSWSIYNPYSEPVFIGDKIQSIESFLDKLNVSDEDIQKAQEKTMSFAAFRLINHRFKNSPSSFETLGSGYKLMQTLGYDPEDYSTSYESGNAAALGNFIAQEIIAFGMQDGSNEQNAYSNKFYSPVNEPMKPHEAGNPNCKFPNRWQQLELFESIDQSGNPVSLIQDFLSPEWGHVIPFALSPDDLTFKERDGNQYWVYHDPGPPPVLDLEKESSIFKWNFELVLNWSSELDQFSNEIVDISPRSIGGLTDEDYPTTFEGYISFFEFDGADPGEGYSINPITGHPYETQLVDLGDYSRVLAEFWADGPSSETPPGHWFTILNYVTDHPDFERKFLGQGEPLSLLEWDVKSYLTMGGAMHDAAITAWGIKGFYDYTRPINAIRYMADLGQSTLPNGPNYNIGGLQLREGLIELVDTDDPLSDNGNNIDKLKIRAWKGPDHISNPNSDIAGVDWILAENWWPYQRPSFVTPPFAGYVSGHSTFSRAAAEVLSLITGNEYFPGGLGEFEAKKNEFLVFEEGPSTTIKLQWAKYRDASDQCSLSRIWGGIHPPVDDIPGRIIGTKIGQDAVEKALTYFGSVSLSTMNQELNYLPKIYPNPIEQGHNLQLGLSGNQVVRIRILDFSGKDIFATELSENFIKWDFGSGLFILMVETDDWRYSHKIIAK